MMQSVPDIAWGKRSRVILDVGCGVASFGGFLFERDVLTMSLAPKDEHEAQVQFALERGIPAISAVMGTKRLPYPGKVFDIVHCARCRVPWHIEGISMSYSVHFHTRSNFYAAFLYLTCFIWAFKFKRQLPYIDNNDIKSMHVQLAFIWKLTVCITVGGKLLLELNRVLRPGGFFVWSATPIYQKLPEDVEIWNGR